MEGCCEAIVMGVIYALIDPTNTQLKYVGQTKRSAKERLRQHICEARSHRSHTYCHKWIRKLLSQGSYPEIEVLETTNELDPAEVFWIQYWKFLGARLTNLTGGGETTTKDTRFLRGKEHWSYGKAPKNWAALKEKTIKEKSKPVRDITNNVIYSSLNEAKRVTGVNNNNIREACHGRYKTAGNRKWEFI